jgi:hypothetical protein
VIVVVEQTYVERKPEAVFDYVSRMEHIPEWMPEDFVSVTPESNEPPRQGARYRYVSKSGRAQGWWEWTAFERPARLAWSGPEIRIGPMGTVKGSGEYVISAHGAGADLRVQISPQFGGPLKLAGPMAVAGIKRRLQKQIARLKERIEGT